VIATDGVVQFEVIDVVFRQVEIDEVVHRATTLQGEQQA
jgi:hypothetical protein